MSELGRGLEVLDFRTIEVSEEERGMMLLAQQLSYENFGPRARAYDRDAVFPERNIDELRRHGYFDIRIPKTFSGKGVSSLAFAAIVVEIAKSDAATALLLALHSTAMAFIEHLATREQQEKMFALVIEEGKRFVPAVQEEGWNLFSGELPKTRLEPCPQGYRVNGQKAFCAHAGPEDVYFGSGLLNGDVLGFVTPANAPGLRRSASSDRMSLRGLVDATVEFEDVFVPEAAVIKLPLNLLFELEYELGQCACHVGIAEAAYRYARELGRAEMARIMASEVGHGHPDAGRLFNAVGAVRLLLEPAWLCVMRAAQVGAVGSFERGLALVQARNIVGQSVTHATALAMQIGGAAALRCDYPIERLFRDAQAAVLLGIKPSDAAYLAGRFELGVAQRGIVMDRSQMRGG